MSLLYDFRRWRIERRIEQLEERIAGLTARIDCMSRSTTLQPCDHEERARLNYRLAKALQRRSALFQHDLIERAANLRRPT